MKGRVLVVDDDAALAEMLGIVLRGEGFEPSFVSDGDKALDAFRDTRPDLVLLDLMLPGADGIDVARRIRAESGVPIVMLTAKSDTIDIVLGLESGADDYIVKPFNPRELNARVKAVLRRAHRLPSNGARLRTNGVEIDLDSRIVTKDGEVVTLTRTEWRLLRELASNAGRVMLNEEILARVWGPDYRDDLQYLRVWISRLRAKLEQVPSEPKIIATFPGIGYMLGAGEVSTYGSQAGNEDDAAHAATG
jgi:two-component system response regulator MtrA